MTQETKIAKEVNKFLRQMYTERRTKLSPGELGKLDCIFPNATDTATLLKAIDLCDRTIDK